MIGFRNVDMAELRIHTPAERVAIAEGHLFRVAFAIFFQLSQAAEFQDVPLSPVFFSLPGNKNRVRRGVNVDIFGYSSCFLLSLVFSPHHLLVSGAAVLTFCGDLPFVPSGIHHHLFENLRRKGHHCHGLTHLSWAERKIFYRVLGKKFCGLFIYPGQSVRQVVAV